MPGRLTEQKTLQFSAILKGLIFSFAVLVLASIILSLLFLVFESLNEDLISRILLVLNYAAIFGGGLITARSTHQKGWLNGGLVGLIYLVIIFILGSQWIDVVFSLDILLRIASGFITGAIGGMLGVNLR